MINVPINEFLNCWSLATKGEDVYERASVRACVHYESDDYMVLKIVK